MPMKRVKIAQIHLQIKPELAERIKAAAKADGRTVTNWIKQAIELQLMVQNSFQPREPRNIPF